MDKPREYSTQTMRETWMFWLETTEIEAEILFLPTGTLPARVNVEQSQARFSIQDKVG